MRGEMWRCGDARGGAQQPRLPCTSLLIPGSSPGGGALAARRHLTRDLLLPQDPFADMRPYHDHENWITKWIRSKMVTPEDREKKLAAILGKMKNGADELCAPPPPHIGCGRMVGRLARAVPLCAGLCAGRAVLGRGLHALPGAARCCFVRLSIPHPLASQARQRRCGGCATTELVPVRLAGERP